MVRADRELAVVSLPATLHVVRPVARKETARSDIHEESSIDNDFILGKIIVFSLLQDVVDKVLAVALALYTSMIPRQLMLPVLKGIHNNSPHDFLSAVYQVVSTLSSEQLALTPLLNLYLQPASRSGEAAASLLDGAGLDRHEDEVDPEMELAPFETAKGLAKGQVADHVKSHEIVPSDNVESLSRLGVLVDTADELVNESLHDILLLPQSLLGEAV